MLYFARDSEKTKIITKTFLLEYNGLTAWCMYAYYVKLIKEKFTQTWLYGFKPFALTDRIKIQHSYRHLQWGMNTDVKFVNVNRPKQIFVLKLCKIAPK